VAKGFFHPSFAKTALFFLRFYLLLLVGLLVVRFVFRR
jgi:hypothetical protein